MKTPILTFVALVVVTVAPLQAKPKKVPLPRSVPVLSTAKDAVDVLDALTKKRFSDVKVKLRGTIGTTKLVVAKNVLDVCVSEEENNWRGTVEVKVEMPAEITYSIDLDKIDWKSLRYDQKTRILRVKAPKVNIESVSGRLEDLEVTATFGGATSSWIDSDIAAALERQALRTNWKPKARERAKAQLSTINSAAKQQLQEFVQKLFYASKTGVTVIVE